MEGDPLTLDCLISSKILFLFLYQIKTCFSFIFLGEEEAELTWLRNNKEIPENPDFRREREGNTFKLVVTEV
jgi:hypothetical protein